MEMRLVQRRAVQLIDAAAFCAFTSMGSPPAPAAPCCCSPTALASTCLDSCMTSFVIVASSSSFISSSPMSVAVIAPSLESSITSIVSPEMGNLSILVIDPRPSFSSPTSTSSTPSFCVAAASDADEAVGMFGGHDDYVVDPIVPAMETKAEATWWPNQRRAPTRV